MELTPEKPAMMAPLFAALAKSRVMAKSVEKDKKNEFHKYKYASAEAIFQEGGYLLAENGLHLIPISINVDPTMMEVPAGKGKKRRGEDGEDLGEVGGTAKVLYLRRKYLLVHSSGASLQLEQDWPILPEAGRPIDKAVAGADTASLGYFVRDLLLLPRVDEGDDLDAPRRGEEVRRETRPEPVREEPKPEVRKEEPPPEKPRKEEPKPEPKTGRPPDPRDAILAEVTDRVGAMDRDAIPPKPQEVGQLIYKLVQTELPELTDEQAEDVLAKLRATSDARLCELFNAAIIPF